MHGFEPFHAFMLDRWRSGDEMQRVPCRPMTEECLSLILRVLEAGKVIAYPTETFYALAVRGLDAEARKHLLEVKGRNSRKPLPLIASDTEQALGLFADRDPRAEELARAFWPGPLTIVGPVRPTYRAVLGSSVGVRVSGEANANEIARRLGEPITSTSANVSGEPPVSDPEKVAASALDIELLVDGGPTPGGQPSSVVSLVSEEATTLLRVGAIPQTDIERVTGPLG